MRKFIVLLVIITALWNSRARGEYDPLGLSAAVTTGESAPTPYEEVVRVLALLPKPLVGFVDYGCGADARWCVAAAEKWGCKCVGIEIDRARADAALERVREAGLGHLITIVRGDATAVDVKADVGVAFLYEDVLVKLRPRIEKLVAFASYRHRPPGLPVTKSGDSWLYVRPAQQAAVQQQPYAMWQGQIYYGPNPGCNCEMCRSIVSQIAAFPVAAPEKVAASLPTLVSSEKQWKLKSVKYCNRRSCWFRDEWVYE